MWTSALIVGITVITGTPLAFVLAQRKFIGKNWVELIVDLPLVLPPAVAGVALLIAFGRRGVFGGWLTAMRISIPFSQCGGHHGTDFCLGSAFCSAPHVSALLKLIRSCEKPRMWKEVTSGNCFAIFCCLWPGAPF